MISRVSPALGLLAAGLLCCTAAPAGAASLGGFGAFPAPRAHQVRPSPYFRLRLAAGAHTTVTAVVVNSSPHPIPLAIVPVAGLTGTTSGAVYGNRTRTGSDQLTIMPAHHDIVLGAHSRRRVMVEVSAGADASAGDHLAGLAVVDRDHHRGHGHFAVIEIVRVVLGISVRVPGAASAQVRIGRIAAEALGGTPDAALRVQIRNAGGLYCAPRLTVRLTGNGHTVVQRRPLGTILPDSSIAYPLPWRHALGRGRYAAKVTARGCGTVQRRHQRLIVGTSRPPALPGAPTTPTAQARSHAWLRWPLLALVGLGGLGLGLLVTRRRGSPPPPGPPEPLQPVPEG